MKKIARKIKSFINFPDKITHEIDELKFMHGQQLASIQKVRDIQNIHEAEFKVFSQWGEDGIIQWISAKLPPPPVRSFIEFGVENYQESNTRFLLMHDNWRGLVIDGSNSNIDFIRKAPYYWRHDLTAVSAFITRENINKIFADNGFTGEIGILSIDVDGNDYWIWEAINSVLPQVVICEYNSIYGADKKVVIPYREDFMRGKAHCSNLYFGASIAALIELGRKKGYSCIGSNSAGNNIFFVRDCYKDLFNIMSSRQAYIESKFRESRNEKGKLSFSAGSERLKLIKDMPLFDIDEDKIMLIHEIYNL